MPSTGWRPSPQLPRREPPFVCFRGRVTLARFSRQPAWTERVIKTSNQNQCQAARPMAPSPSAPNLSQRSATASYRNRQFSPRELTPTIIARKGRQRRLLTAQHAGRASLPILAAFAYVVPARRLGRHSTARASSPVLLEGSQSVGTTAMPQGPKRKISVPET